MAPIEASERRASRRYRRRGHAEVGINRHCRSARDVSYLGLLRSVDELTALFRSRGLRVTPQRQAIFRALTHATQHPTAEGVYAAVSTELPTISLRTVYQTLNDLSAMGELSVLNLGTGSTRFDPNLEPHHHLVCDVCGRIEDLRHEFPGVLLPA